MWLIYKKEMMELLRDKKTLIFTILLPTLIIPVILGGFAYFSIMMDKKHKSEQLNFSIIGAENAPEFVSMLKTTKGFKFNDKVDITNVAEVIRKGKVKFIVEIPPQFRDQIDHLKQTSVTLHFNAASSGSKVKSRLQKVISKFNEQLQKMQLGQVNLDEETLQALTKPIKLKTKSIANKREKFGEIVGGMAAYMLLIITLSGAIYPALDLGVGEKERQTLETLLLNPVPRWQLVMSKFLVIFTTGFLAVFLALLSVLGWTLIAGQAFSVAQLSQILQVIGIGPIMMMMFMLVPTSAIFAAILLTISIYARNFKEAQNYISPLMMLVIMPVLIAMVPGIELNWTTAMVPLTNIALAMKEILKGTMDYSILMVIFGSTSLLAGAAIWFCSYWFSQEKVLFRS